MLERLVIGNLAACLLLAAGELFSGSSCSGFFCLDLHLFALSAAFLYYVLSAVSWAAGRLLLRSAPQPDGNAERDTLRAATLWHGLALIVATVFWAGFALIALIGR